MTQQEQLAAALAAGEENAKTVARLQSELDKLREDIQVQGQTQTDIELNQLGHGAILAEIKSWLDEALKGGESDVRED